MERDIYTALENWKDAPHRKPLLLRGVRQCGKTWILKEFGRHNFSDVVYFSFENNTPLALCFQPDLNPVRILKELSFLCGRTIVPGRTFLIFDEIQFCAPALTALKYFCEEMPQLHIACAGSLLGVHLAKSAGSFPVGKVDFLTLYPMNFREFLMACGKSDMVIYLESLEPGKPVSASTSALLEALYHEYLITGGMPEVVSRWVETQSISETDRTLQAIVTSYEADFMKYAPAELLPKLTLIWRAIPEQLAKDNHKFIFSHVKKGMKSRDLEDALNWLIAAGIVLKVEKVERPAIPLSLGADTTNFKIYLCDAGLLRSLSAFPAAGVTAAVPVVSDMRGALTENFVLTEILTAGDTRPYFWKHNESEVEFVIQSGLMVIPVEVKAAKNTRSRSLAAYRTQYHPTVALRTSLMNAALKTDETGNLIEIPLYLLWNLKTILSR